MAAGWEGLKATPLTALDGVITGVVSFGDRSVAIFTGAFDAMKAIWGRLPAAIGDFAFQAANGLIGGVEAMLNGVVTRINGFISALNSALDLLPDWATGEGGVRIGTLDPVALGQIDNPFAGAAEAAGAAAADAFSAALARSYVDAPDLGLGAAADDARARADGYREAAGMLSDAATRPLAAWDALKAAVAGSGSESEAALRMPRLRRAIWARRSAMPGAPRRVPVRRPGLLPLQRSPRPRPPSPAGRRSRRRCRTTPARRARSAATSARASSARSSRPRTRWASS